MKSLVFIACILFSANIFGQEIENMISLESFENKDSLDFWPNGKLRLSFKYSEETNKLIVYSRSGAIERTYFFDSEGNGVCVGYYNDLRIHFSGEIRKYARHGKWITYDKQSCILEWCLYKKGNVQESVKLE